MKKILFVVMILASSVSLFAQTEKEEMAKKIMIISGAADMSQLIMDQIFDGIKQRNPNQDYDFLDRFRAEVNTDTLITLLVPVYTKYFTLEEMQDLYDFYQSPTGQKLVSTQPDVMKESMEVGRQWATILAMKVMEEINKHETMDQETETDNSTEGL